MLGLHIKRNKAAVLGTSIVFRPGTSLYFTNHKGLGISIILQSPIEFHLLLPRRSRIR